MLSRYNKWYSKGFPSQPAWGWTKLLQKKSLYEIGMADTASASMLNLVELVHWAPLIPAFLMAYSILSNSNRWTSYFDDDEQRTLLFLLSLLWHFSEVFQV